MKINIQELCTKKGISLYKLAQLVGVKQQTVYSWRDLRTQPNYQHMDDLCRVLECGMGELFSSEKEVY